jgi:hypothetical protein
MEHLLDETDTLRARETFSILEFPNPALALREMFDPTTRRAKTDICDTTETGV